MESLGTVFISCVLLSCGGELCVMAQVNHSAISLLQTSTRKTAYFSNQRSSRRKVVARPARAMDVVSGISLGHTATQF